MESAEGWIELSDAEDDVGSHDDEIDLDAAAEDGDNGVEPAMLRAQSAPPPLHEQQDADEVPEMLLADATVGAHSQDWAGKPTVFWRRQATTPQLQPSITASRDNSAATAAATGVRLSLSIAYGF